MTTQPIAKEIKQVSGFDSIDDLARAMPDNPDAPGAGTEPSAKRKRKPRAPSSPKAPGPVADPFANDKRYQEACSEMSAFGGKQIIEGGFDAGAKLLKDPDFKLNAKEERSWDNFFYVLSKKALFDVGNPIFLALFFIITICAQLGKRLLERTEAGETIKAFFSKKAEGEGEPDAENERD